MITTKLALFEINDSNKLYVALVLAAIFILLIILIWILCRFVFFKKFRYRAKIKDFNKKYLAYHEKTTIDIKADLKRINEIGTLNVEYENKAQTYLEHFNKILETIDAPIKNHIDVYTTLVNSREYVKSKEEIEKIKGLLNNYQDEISALKNEMSVIIVADNNAREKVNELKIKRTYLDEKITSLATPLSNIASSISELQNIIAKKYDEVNTLITSAHYDEGLSEAKELKTIIEQLDASLDVLPQLVLSAFIIENQHIDELEAHYNELVSSEFPLHHLKVLPTLQSLRKKLVVLQQKLATFNYQGVDAEINKIEDQISELNLSMDKEVEAKKQYDERSEDVYQRSYQVDNNFIKVERRIGEFQKSYVLKEEYTALIKKIQNNVDELDTVKHNLDIFTHSASRPPYSSILAQLSVLDESIKDVDEALNKITVYLDSLKPSLEEAYKFITSSYLALKDKEYSLRQIGVNEITKTSKSRFETSYALLNECGNLINTIPFDVDKIEYVIGEAKLSINDLLTHYAGYEENAKEVENAIFKANSIRNVYYDVEKTLPIAEKSFFEGDFTRASDLVHQLTTKFSIKK